MTKNIVIARDRVAYCRFLHAKGVNQKDYGYISTVERMLGFVPETLHIFLVKGYQETVSPEMLTQVSIYKTLGATVTYAAP